MWTESQGNHTYGPAFSLREGCSHQPRGKGSGQPGWLLCKVGDEEEQKQVKLLFRGWEIERGVRKKRETHLGHDLRGCTQFPEERKEKPTKISEGE